MDNRPLGQALGELLAGLIKLPFELLGYLLRLLFFVHRRRQGWAAQSLQTRSHCRAAFGAAGLTGLAMFVIERGGISSRREFYCIAAIGAVAALYLAGGLIGSRQAARVDPFSLMWWGLGAVGCVAAVIFYWSGAWASWL